MSYTVTVDNYNFTVDFTPVAYTATISQVGQQGVPGPRGDVSISSRKNVAAVLADTTWTYTTGQLGTVTAGDIVTAEAEGFSHEVAASGATDHYVVTDGGVKLKLLRNNGGRYDLTPFMTATPATNAARFLRALELGYDDIVIAGGPYSFDFNGSAATFSGDVLSIDLGPEKHTWENYGGMTASALKKFKWNGRITANNTQLKNIVRGDVLELVEIDTVEVTDVYMNAPSGADQCFLFEWRHGSEIPFQLTCKNGVFRRMVNQSAATPMTGFGNFQTFLGLRTPHLLHFENLDVEDFYSVDTDGTTIIYGESDFFRIFNNPTTVVVENLKAVNVGKRFLKTQVETVFIVEYCYTSLDSRFTQAVNHISIFENQNVAGNFISRCIIRSADIDFSDAGGTPLIYNASGLDHEFFLSNAKFQNCGVFSSSQDILVELNDVKGSGFSVNATNSTRIRAYDFVDTAMYRWVEAACYLENFKITPAENSTTLLLNNATLRRGEFLGCDTRTALASTSDIDDVSVEYTTGTTDGRPFRPIRNETTIAKNVTIDNQTATAMNYFFEAGGSGTLIVNNFVANNGNLAAFTGGTWSVQTVNCNPSLVSGVGVSAAVSQVFERNSSARTDAVVTVKDVLSSTGDSNGVEVVHGRFTGSVLKSKYSADGSKAGAINLLGNSWQFESRLSGWSNPPLRLGSYYIWVSDSGVLRIKNGTPTSSDDGTAIGSQS